MSPASIEELTGVLAQGDRKNGNSNEEIEILPIFSVARISRVAFSHAMTGKVIPASARVFGSDPFLGRMDLRKVKASQ
jgi:hypothetical protein